MIGIPSFEDQKCLNCDRRVGQASLDRFVDMGRDIVGFLCYKCLNVNVIQVYRNICRKRGHAIVAASPRPNKRRL